jgi:hypothetical protein
MAPGAIVLDNVQVDTRRQRLVGERELLSQLQPRHVGGEMEHPLDARTAFESQHRAQRQS